MIRICLFSIMLGTIFISVAAHVTYLLLFLFLSSATSCSTSEEVARRAGDSGRGKDAVRTLSSVFLKMPASECLWY